MARFTPAIIIDEDALTEAIRDAFKDVPQEESGEKATPQQFIAVADAYVRRLRQKFGET